MSRPMDTGNERTCTLSTRVRFRPDKAQAGTMAPPVRKRSQRERLLRAMVELASRGGYTAANVSAVAADAGVSKPTFYDYFADREDCFTQTIVGVQEEVNTAVRATLDAAERPSPLT